MDQDKKVLKIVSQNISQDLKDEIKRFFQSSDRVLVFAENDEITIKSI